MPSTTYRPGDRISLSHQNLKDAHVYVEVKCSGCGETDDFPNDRLYTQSAGEIICPYTLEMECQYCDSDGDTVGEMKVIEQSIDEDKE